MLDSTLWELPMPTVPNPLTYDEHQELGREILNTKARLVQLGSMAATVYGVQSRTAFHFQKLTEAMDKLCDELQAQAEQDCPGLDAPAFYR